jgi:hypothetical protein
MNRADELLEMGMRAELANSAVRVLVGGKYVAAVENMEPQSFEMLDSSYLVKEPVAIEVLKGRENSTEVIEVRGVDTPVDLRGFVPTMRMGCVIGNAARMVVRVQDAGSRWILTTVRKAVAE